MISDDTEAFVMLGLAVICLCVVLVGTVSWLKQRRRERMIRRWRWKGKV